MSPRQALISALHLFIVLTFFVAGLFFVSLPHLPEMKTQLLEKAPLIGFSLFLTALTLFLGFYALDRGRYLVIDMQISADVKLIRQTVEDCFERQFPNKISLSEIEIDRKSRLEMKVSLASLDKEMLLEVEKQLGILLKERFGYSKPFRLIVKI